MATRSLAVRAHNRLLRLRQWRWRMAGHHSDARHIVMGGAPRSGTTLLRKLLDRHPEVCAGPETKLFVPAAFNLGWLARAYGLPEEDLRAMRTASASQGAFIDAFAARVRADRGKPRWAEKTPQNIRHVGWIAARWPEAAIIHIIRDGRDVVCSMRQHPDWRWVDGDWHKVLVPRSTEWYAQRWLADTASGMAWRDHPRYVEVRYEDLVADPGSMLRSMCDAIGIRLDSAWLDAVARQPTPDGEDGARPDYEGAVSRASVGRWRTDLSPQERADVERLCGPRLRDLGYDV